MIEITDIQSLIPKLKPLPDTAMQIISAVNNPNASAADIVDAVRYDQVLTGKVLQIVNSAYFGLNKEVTSLKEALIVLGTNRLTQIILLAIPDSPLHDKVEGYGLEKGELWIHSASVAIATQYLGKLVKFPDPNLLFTAGLLHDIGKCVLHKYVGADYDKLMRKINEEELDFAEAERDLFGLDHAEAGWHVAREWGLPEGIAKVILYHHHPEEVDEPDQAVDLVYVGDMLSLLMGYGLGKDGLYYRSKAEVLERNSLGPEDLEKACASLFQEISFLKEHMFS